MRSGYGSPRSGQGEAQGASSRGRLVLVIQAIERALEDDRRGQLVDHLGAPFARLIGVDQHSLSFRGRQPFVPEQYRQRRHFIEIARECPGRLCARTLRPVHIAGETQHQPSDAVLCDQGEETDRVGRKLGPADRFEGRGYRAPYVRKGEAQRFGARIDADEASSRDGMEFVLIFRGAARYRWGGRLVH